eukprot:scaffold33550_cov114-Skeletonema_dohrnii-CCMP3373.AAC.6
MRGRASKRCSSEDLQTMPSMVEYAKGVNIYFSEGRCAYLSRHGAGVSVNYATVKDATNQAKRKRGGMCRSRRHGAHCNTDSIFLELRARRKQHSWRDDILLRQCKEIVDCRCRGSLQQPEKFKDQFSLFLP